MVYLKKKLRMKTVLITSILFIALASCNQEEKKPQKTPTIYGVEFCDCVIKNEMDDTKCRHIIEENKKVFGAKNKEAEEEFKAAAITCIKNKTAGQNL